MLNTTFVLVQSHHCTQSPFFWHFNCSENDIKQLNHPLYACLPVFFQNSIGISTGLVVLPLLILRIALLTSSTCIHLQYPKSPRLTECSNSSNMISMSTTSFKS
uniref:Putative ovule protein n=1 Tax=Solanum chacoense TaxID=4108 RepID=A0A0V0GRQ1_SOLCH